MMCGLSIGVIGVSGCAKKTEMVYLQPDCNVPPMVTEADLPTVKVNAVYDALESYHGEEKGKEIAEDLRERERRLVDSLLEHRAIVKELCQ